MGTDQLTNRGAVRLLSIDYGTTNTVVGLAVDGQAPRTVEFDGATSLPSAVFVAADGVVSVGRDAVRQARLDPARYEANPKRRIDDGDVLLGDRVVPVVELIAAVLRQVHTEVRRQLGPQPVDEVRLTHPAGWGPTRQNVLVSAARSAGLGEHLVLVPEPVAAAAQYTRLAGRELSPGGAVAVYDLGGGTLDVAVVGRTQDDFQVLAEDGLSDLGGLDFDQAVLDQVGRTTSNSDPARWQQLLRPVDLPARRAARALADDVRAAKETLSRHSQTEIALSDPFPDAHLTRIEFEGLIRPQVVRSIEVLDTALRRSGVPADRLTGIFLVGGSSRIPLVATLIQQHLGVTPVALDQPETAVALGALLVPIRRSGLRTQQHQPAGPAATGTPAGGLPDRGVQPQYPPTMAGSAPTAIGQSAPLGQVAGPPTGNPWPANRRSKARWWWGGAAVAAVLAALLVLLIVQPFAAEGSPDAATFAADVESGMSGVRTITGTLDGGTGTQAGLRETLQDGRLQGADIAYSVSTSGQSLDVTIRLIGGKAYLGGTGVRSLLPQTAGNKQWLLLDAQSTDTTVSSIGASLGGLLTSAGTDSYVYLLRGATSVTRTGDEVVGTLAATRYTVQIDVPKAAAAMPAELDSYRKLLAATPGQAQAGYWIDAQHRVVKAEITMPDSGSGQRTALTVSAFDSSFTIEAPDPATVYPG